MLSIRHVNQKISIINKNQNNSNKESHAIANKHTSFLGERYSSRRRLTSAVKVVGSGLARLTPYSVIFTLVPGRPEALDPGRAGVLLEEEGLLLTEQPPDAVEPATGERTIVVLSEGERNLGTERGRASSLIGRGVLFDFFEG